MIPHDEERLRQARAISDRGSDPTALSQAAQRLRSTHPDSAMFLDIADLLELASAANFSPNHFKHVTVLRQMQLAINRESNEWYALDYALSVLRGVRAVPPKS